MIVCGGRDYTMDAVDWRRLDALHEGDHDMLGLMPRLGPLTAVYHGDAPGADRWAAFWGETRGVPVTPFPADWKTFGKAGGPVRNGAMLAGLHPTLGRLPEPDAVIAFPGGPGTDDMISQARRAGRPVLDLREHRWRRWTAEHVRDLAEFTSYLTSTAGREADTDEVGRRALRMANAAHGGLAIPIVQAHLYRRTSDKVVALPPGSIYCGRATMLRADLELPVDGNGCDLGNPVRYSGDLTPAQTAAAMDQFRAHLRIQYRRSARVRELVDRIGREQTLLACWCHESKPCHTTVIADAAQLVRASREMRERGLMLPPAELPARFARSTASGRSASPSSSEAA